MKNRRDKIMLAFLFLEYSLFIYLMFELFSVLRGDK